MKASTDSTSAANFRNFGHRMSYVAQAIIARKFSKSISIALHPTYVHRNFVAAGDENSLFALGIGGRFKFSKRFGIIIEYFYPFSKLRHDQNSMFTYNDPLSIGVELETGGHIFHINFTNSEGILANDWIPYTRGSWLDGGFRFGFTISRRFVILRK